MSQGRSRWHALGALVAGTLLAGFGMSAAMAEGVSNPSVHLASTPIAAMAGQQVTHKITVRGAAGAGSKGVQLTFKSSAELQDLAVNGTDSACDLVPPSSVTCLVTTTKPDSEPVTITVTGKIAASAKPGAAVYNVATVVSAGDSETADNSSADAYLLASVAGTAPASASDPRNHESERDGGQLTVAALRADISAAGTPTASTPVFVAVVLAAAVALLVFQQVLATKRRHQPARNRHRRSAAQRWRHARGGPPRTAQTATYTTISVVVLLLLGLVVGPALATDPTPGSGGAISAPLVSPAPSPGPQSLAPSTSPQMPPSAHVTPQPSTPPATAGSTPSPANHSPLTPEPVPSAPPQTGTTPASTLTPPPAASTTPQTASSGVKAPVPGATASRKSTPPAPPARPAAPVKPAPPAAPRRPANPIDPIGQVPDRGLAVVEVPVDTPNSDAAKSVALLQVVLGMTSHLSDTVAWTDADLTRLRGELGSMESQRTRNEDRIRESQAAAAILDMALGSNRAELKRLEAEAETHKKAVTDLAKRAVTAPAPASRGTESANYAGGRLLRPVNGGVNSEFGSRYDPYYHRQQLHAGIDLDAGAGVPIRAAADGTVSQAGENGGYGNFTCIEHGQFQGDRLTTCYAHQSSIGVHVGQRVAAGDVIGHVGSTGASTGPHLHFEVRVAGRPVDPAPWL